MTPESDCEPEINVSVLRVSIVCYATDEDQLRKTVRSLVTSGAAALDARLIDRIDIFLADNGPAIVEREKIESIFSSLLELASPEIKFHRIGDGKNVGFGVGHNQTIDPGASDFHLALNPDVELSSDSLSKALEFMREHIECGLLSPAITDGLNEAQYPCKRYPSVLDLALRGFAPGWLRDMFSARLALYEMRDRTNENVLWQPPIVSGCFMLLRASLIEKIKGFDPAFFLYFEDFDLSLRAAKVSKIAYVPSVKIVHHGGNAAKKSWRHILLFVRSAVQFFNKHGWKFF
jgi:GT2 family glycosyltransferase